MKILSELTFKVRRVGSDQAFFAYLPKPYCYLHSRVEVLNYARRLVSIPANFAPGARLIRFVGQVNIYRAARPAQFSPHAAAQDKRPFFPKEG